MNLNTIIDRKLKSKTPRKKIIAIALILLIIALTAVVAINLLNSRKPNTAARLQTAIVRKGDLSVTVSGSGPISSSNKYDLTSNVSGTLIKVNFKDGDKVKAGDLIFEIDDKDTQLQIKQLQNSIAQAELSRNSSLKDLESSVITAPFDGEVSDVQIKEGDNVSNNGTLLTITDKSKLKLLVTFSNTYRSKLSVGQEVAVNAFDNSAEELYKVNGNISSISSPSYKTSDGAEVYNVGVVIENPGSLSEGMVANAVINIDGKEFTSKGSGTLSYIKSMTVRAAAGGTVSSLKADNGQIVKKGDVLAEIESEELKLSIETSNLKLEDLYTQLETARQKLLDYKIYAPFEGTFTLSDVKQGNSIKQGDVLGSIANYDTMEFTIDVDELDIAKIQVGQAAKVTIDAIPETTDDPLKGTVTKIAVEGSSSNGVSTYPVTVQIEKNEALKGGMSANAEIVVSQKTGVLYVPVDAVQKRNGKSYVRVAVGASGASRTGRNQNPEAKPEVTSEANEQLGTEQQVEMREVTTGISTAEYIEITGGLKEGEAVVVTSAANNTNVRQMQPGGIGIPMGAPQSGGGGKFQNQN